MTLNAILCEGAAEQAILEILLENDVLTIKKESLLEEKVFRERSAESFFKKHMRVEFDEKVTIYRILDSKNENFKVTNKIKKDFQGKYEVVDIITSPEIEMLVIISEGRFIDYSKVKSKVKPSEYCKQSLKLRQIKEYDFIRDYFSDVKHLINVIRQYHSLMKVNKDNFSLTLYDLLESEYK